jgi:DNA invertase Pin-like site-specific DNA recombinase
VAIVTLAKIFARQLSSRSLRAPQRTKCYLDMLAVFAEFETNLCRERQPRRRGQAKVAEIDKVGAPIRRVQGL